MSFKKKTENTGRALGDLFPGPGSSGPSQQCHETRPITESTNHQLERTRTCAAATSHTNVSSASNCIAPTDLSLWDELSASTPSVLNEGWIQDIEQHVPNVQSRSDGPSQSTQGMVRTYSARYEDTDQPISILSPTHYPVPRIYEHLTKNEPAPRLVEQPLGNDARKISFRNVDEPTSTILVDMTGPGHIHTSSANDAELVCRYSGCAYRKPFRRKADLNRHMKTKHPNAPDLRCPARECFEGQERKTFPRADKLIDHMRAKHNADTLVQCPYEECSGRLIHWDELNLHLQKDHGLDRSLNRGCGKDERTGRALLVAGPLYRCPAWTCKERFGFYPPTWIEHLLQHGLDELEVAWSEIWKKNLLLESIGCPHA